MYCYNAKHVCISNLSMYIKSLSNHSQISLCISKPLFLVQNLLIQNLLSDFGPSKETGQSRSYGPYHPDNLALDIC